jgi:hypothetical protein
LLQRRGYTIRYEKASDAWFAERAGFVFRGDNPIELLGLAAIHEDVKPPTGCDYWWKIDDPDLLSELDPESK